MAFVYLLRCADDTLYCGWTTDIDRRLAAHRSGAASRYTRSRRPVELAVVIPVANRSAALREEARIKRLPRDAKLRLIETWAHYDGPMSSQRVPGGVVHELPADLREELLVNATALDAWNDITPLARNEFICWVEDAKQETTRARRIRRTKEELEEGQRRPCCWPGCKHRERTGKAAQ